MSIRIMCISDLHYFKNEEIEVIANTEYDLCILLGDIPVKALKLIKKANGERPICGVCGNHDSFLALSSVGIKDLHCTSIEVNGYIIAGMSGSNRYNDEEDYAMISQGQSVIYADKCPNADIFMTHDAPYKLFYKLYRDKAHKGLKGISKYIKKKKPKLNLCGHYHENIKVKYHKSDVECIFRFKMIDFS